MNQVFPPLPSVMFISEAANNKHLRGETSRRRGDNCEARFICFCPSVVFAAAACNQHASERDGQKEGMSGRTEGGLAHVVEPCFCFLTDATKPFRRGKTVVFSCRHRPEPPVPTESGLNGGVTTATNPSSLCLPEREVKDSERMKRRERRDGDKEERDCVRREKEAERCRKQREQSCHLSAAVSLVLLQQKGSRKTMKSCCYTCLEKHFSFHS